MTDDSKFEQLLIENELMRELLDKYSTKYIEIIDYVRDTNQETDKHKEEMQQLRKDNDDL